MYKISKEFSFDAAHMLDGHCGKCNNVHGHTYRIRISFFNDKVIDNDKSDQGMVLDFYKVKELMSNIINNLDHSFIYNYTNTNEKVIGELLQSMGRKTYKIDFRSTCENLSKHIYQLIKTKIDLKTSVEVWETPTSSCLYEGE